MKELEVLLNQRWVLKSENKELYYQLRDACLLYTSPSPRDA